MNRIALSRIATAAALATLGTAATSSPASAACFPIASKKAADYEEEVKAVCGAMFDTSYHYWMAGKGAEFMSRQSKVPAASKMKRYRCTAGAKDDAAVSFVAFDLDDNRANLYLLCTDAESRRSGATLTNLNAAINHARGATEDFRHDIEDVHWKSSTDPQTEVSYMGWKVDCRCMSSSDKANSTSGLDDYQAWLEFTAPFPVKAKGLRSLHGKRIKYDLCSTQADAKDLFRVLAAVLPLKPATYDMTAVTLTTMLPSLDGDALSAEVDDGADEDVVAGEQLRRILGRSSLGSSKGKRCSEAKHVKVP